MTTPVVEFNAVQFCESLFSEACKAAKERVGQEPMLTQVQMIDLVTAFRKLRKEDYTNQFGLIAGEWNESIAIIKSYISAATIKAQRILHPELGLTIGSIIEQWGKFEELPKELQGQIRKAKEQFKNIEDAFMVQLNHFFNEMKVRAASLDSPEKEGIASLVSLYRPQARTACHKGEVEAVLHLLGQLLADIQRLSMQRTEPSRPMEQLLIKTRHDLSELESFGNKSKKTHKKPAAS